MKELVDRNIFIAHVRKDEESFKIQTLQEHFPKLNEHLRVAQLCKGMGFTVEIIKKLFNG